MYSCRPVGGVERVAPPVYLLVVLEHEGTQESAELCAPPGQLAPSAFYGDLGWLARGNHRNVARTEELR
jgi:hypothetical protein